MKFTIRDLFLLTMIVAVCVAWWLDRAQCREQVRRISIEKTAATEELAQIRVVLLKPEIQVALVKSMSQAYSVPPDSSAPAPNPPKP